MMVMREECGVVPVHQDKIMKMMMIMIEECWVVHVRQEMMKTMMMKVADGMAILKVILKHHAVDGNIGSSAGDVLQQTGEAVMTAEVVDATVAEKVRGHQEATAIAADGMVTREAMLRQQ